MTQFSVIISLYNKEHLIGETLKSVLVQTFGNFEIIIVNDGSTDGSEQVVKSIDDARIHYFTQENMGASAGRNAAISKASGQYLALLDADDIWEPTYLETIDSLIKAHPKQDVFATAVTLETSSSPIPSIYSIKNIEPNGVYVVNYFESSFINTLLTSSSTVLHQRVIQKVGAYDTSIKSGQDTDLWIRIGIQYQIVFINKALVTYRYEKQSLSNQTKRVIDKPKFNAYIALEATNKSLKKFMDLNRFSMAMLSKLDHDQASFKAYEKEIDCTNLNKKQRILLKQPARIIRLLHTSKKIMQGLGIHFSTFK